MPGSLRLRRAALAGIALASALVALVQPDAAQAHAFLVRSEPEAGSRLATAPDAIVFHFTESFVPASERIVLRDGADVVETRPPTRKGTVLRQPLPSGLRGVFVVNWRVLSDDGHVSVGEFAFAVGLAGVLPKSSSTASGMPWPEVLASWLFFAGLALVLGGLASETFVWRRIRAFHEGRARAPASVGLAVAAAGAVLTLILLAGSRAGGGFATGLDLGALGEALRTRPGALTAGVVATLAAAAVLVASASTRPLALLPLVAAAVLTSLRGHSGTSGHWWAVAADSVHLAGAALWAGALAHLVLVLGRARRGRFRSTLLVGARRYAALALPIVLVVMASGAVTALAEFRSLGELIDTGYGRTLLVKGGIVALALGLAFAARRGALPAGSRPVVTSFRRLSPLELATLALVPFVLALVVPNDPVRLIAFGLFLAALAYIVIALRRIVRDRPEIDPRTRVRRYALVGVAAVFALFASGAAASLARSQRASTEAEGDVAAIVRVLLV
ncbi:MAG: copper resistance protein CopC, partial [Thermoleophilaceae bacterium]